PMTRRVGSGRVVIVLTYISLDLYAWRHARVRRPRRPRPAPDPRAAGRWRAPVRGDHGRRPGRVRDHAAGRLAAPQGPARQRVRLRATGWPATALCRRRRTVPGARRLAPAIPRLLGAADGLARHRARARQARTPSREHHDRHPRTEGSRPMIDI